MPPRRGRPRKGDRRIDAAIDHFGAMGYAARDVQAVVQRLLKTYEIGADAWPLLEEGSYQVVQDMLFEEEEKQKQLLLEHHPMEKEHQMEVDQQPQEEEQQGEVGQEPPQEEEQQEEMGQEPPQNQGLEEDEAPPESSSTAMIKVHSEVPDGRAEDPLPAELPAAKVPVQLIMARPQQTRAIAPPCYGYISESDDELSE